MPFAGMFGPLRALARSRRLFPLVVVAACQVQEAPPSASECEAAARHQISLQVTAADVPGAKPAALERHRQQLQEAVGAPLRASCESDFSRDR